MTPTFLLDTAPRTQVRQLSGRSRGSRRSPRKPIQRPKQAQEIVKMLQLHRQKNTCLDTLPSMLRRIKNYGIKVSRDLCLIHP